MKAVCVGMLFGLTLISCTEVSSVETTCNAANWQELIGEPEAAVHSALGNIRIVRADDPVNADFNPNRLNAETDSKGRVQRFARY